MEYFTCFKKSCLKLIGFKFFEPYLYFDYKKTISIGIYDNKILLFINNRYYKLTNIVKINQNNYKIFFTDNYMNVVFISIDKKTTYLLIEIIDCFYNYEKSLIVDSSYSKLLYNFFDFCRSKQIIYINKSIVKDNESIVQDNETIVQDNESIVQDLIIFLQFQDIYL